MKIIPYILGSQSAKSIAEALGIKRYRREGVPIKGNDAIINWGCSSIEREIFQLDERILNHPVAVKKASNKLETFKALHGNVPIPKYTTSANEAMEWLGKGSVVVARHKLTGHSGEGIELYSKPEEFKVAPLYTEYVKKEHEFRIHVFGGEVIFQQRKARKLEVPDDQVNWKIRNHANGFVFAHQNVEIPEEMKLDCIDAVELLDLDFGAVDVIQTRKGEHFILEVNTACGLEGATLDAYVKAFGGI